MGFPLSRQKPQPERATRPPNANESRLPTVPHGLQPQPRVNTDRWYYRVFQSAPDLVRSLLPGSSATATANALSLDPSAPGDSLYRYFYAEALRL